MTVPAITTLDSMIFKFNVDLPKATGISTTTDFTGGIVIYCKNI